MKPVIGHQLDGGKAVRIDLSSLIESRLLIQANSGGGKSHTLRALLELTHGHVQHVVIDPEGEFATLREQFDYVYAAPKGGDCLATPQTAELLARRVMELRCNIIIDIYELKHHEKTLFIKRFLDALINLPKDLWHECVVVLDEAHKYAPESGKGKAESLPAVIDLASLGRKRGYCAWIATQRAAKLSKDVTAELNNQIIGRARIKEDRKRNAEELGITDKEDIARFGKLDKGEFFVQGPAITDELSLVKIVGVQTSHPKIGRKAGKTPAPSAKVKKILAELADLPKEAQEEARTVEELRTEIKRLRQEVLQAARENKDSLKTALSKNDLEKIRRQVYTQAQADYAKLRREFMRDLGGAKRKLATFHERFKKYVLSINDGLKALVTTFEEGMNAIDVDMPDEPDPKSMTLVNIPTATPTARIVEQAKRVVTKLTTPSNGEVTIGKGERATLIAVAQHGEAGVAPEQLSVLTGYKRSSRDAYLARLRKAGFITDGKPIIATEAGIAELGNDYEPLPTGTKLREYWMSRLPEGEKKCLGILIEAYPNEVSCEEIDERTQYKRSSRDAFLSRLGARKLITKPSRGAAKAAETLFN